MWPRSSLSSLVSFLLGWIVTLIVDPSFSHRHVKFSPIRPSFLDFLLFLDF